MQLSKHQLEHISPAVRMHQQGAAILPALNEAMLRFGISESRTHVRSFVTACAIYSAGFEDTGRMLPYNSINDLVQAYPTKFRVREHGGDGNLAYAGAYVGKTYELAKIIYANIFGNGEPWTEDGWRYRPQGLIKLFGKDRFAKCSMDIFGDDTLVKNPELISMDTSYWTAAMVSAWVWNFKGMAAMADAGDHEAIHNAIDGNRLRSTAYQYTLARAIDVLPEIAVKAKPAPWLRGAAT